MDAERILSSLNFPSDPLLSLLFLLGCFFSRPRQRRDYFAVKDEDPSEERGCFRGGGAMSLDPPTFWSIVRPLSRAPQLIKSTVQMRRRLKASRANSYPRVFFISLFSLLFFSSIAEQNHSAIRANFIAIFANKSTGQKAFGDGNRTTT